MANPVVMDIAPRGDVVLVCTDKQESSTTYRLRTSSHVLQLGSTVFRAMLGPYFKEGEALATNGSVEIELPEDDPQAMITMCKVLHFSPDVMEQTPRYGDLPLLARHADKYDTIRALGPTTYIWILHALFKNISVSGAMLLGVALTFNHGDLFNRIAKQIVLGCWDPTKLPTDYGPKILPSILSKLEALRDREIKGFGRTIDAHVTLGTMLPTQVRDCGCGYQEAKLFAELNQLHKARLWPYSVLKNNSLGLTIEKAKSFQLVLNRGRCHGTVECNERYLSAKDGLSSVLHDRANAVDKDLKFCIKCAGSEDWVLPANCSHP